MRVGSGFLMDVSNCTVTKERSAGASYVTSCCVRLSRLTAPVQLGGPEILGGVSVASRPRLRIPRQPCDPSASRRRR
jgi:hypothetical protein